MGRFDTIPDYYGSLDGNELIEIYIDGVSYRIPLYKALAITPLTVTSNPVSFAATMVDHEQIDLTWTNGADNYILEYSHNEVSWTQIYSGAAGAYSHIGLYPDNQYFYRLKAQETGQYDSGFVTDDATTDVAP